MKREFLFYSTLKGRTPASEFIESLPKKDNEKIYYTLDSLQEIDRLGYPYYKKFANYLIDFGELIIGRYRIFVSRIDADTYLLLHGFIKKSYETPKQESEKAYSYLIEYINRTQ